MAPDKEIDPYEGVDVNLDSEDIDAGRQPLPDVATNFVVRSAERKRADGGKFPYVALVLSPASDDPKLARRKAFLNMSFHPDMLWQMRDVRKAMGLDTAINVRKLLENPNSDQDYVGQRFSCVPKIKPSQNDPDRKINEISGPFRAAF